MQYANKDYEAIFEYLKAKAIELSDGQWTDFTDGDFGTIVIHLLAYWGDLLSNQLDITASELFLNTAEERTSLVEICKLIGYEPSHFQSAITYLDITYKKDETQAYQPYQLPAFTKFYNTDGSITYYNLYPATLSEETTTITTYEGTKVSKMFYFDDIDEYGRISLNDYYVATNTVLVSLTNNSVNGPLSRKEDVRFSTGELCYSLHVDLDGIPYIQLPVYWKTVISPSVVFEVVYLDTEGVKGRVGANAISKSTDNNLKNYTIINPEASVGGYDPETVKEIQVKASIFARTMYTCVTLKDFEDMSMFVDDIAQVKALDYNNKEEEFPPTISAYKQPTPPNGVPNDAYKVLIMAVPSDISVQTIFTNEDEETYSKLTRAAQQLQEIYDDRKAATLYLEYRDPSYINPWLILNVYLEENDLKIPTIAQNIVDYLKILYNRGRLRIGESVYGSVIGKELLNQFSCINYIEVRDPEYNIEAKPYEYIDINNGYHQIFVNDKLKYVPKGLQIRRLNKREYIRLKDIENNHVEEIEWCPSEVYQEDPSYILNSYAYKFDKGKGNYPRLDLNKVGVLYENETMVLTIPDNMLDFTEDQVLVLDNNENKYMYIYSEKYKIGDFIEYQEENDNGILYGLPSYVTVNYEDTDMVVSFPSYYNGVISKKYQLDMGQIITMTKPNKDEYTFSYMDYNTEPTDCPSQVYYKAEDGQWAFYVPSTWEVEVN